MMISTEEQKALDEELLRESYGYSTRANKPDGAYIEVKGQFYNLNKIKRLIVSGADVNAKNKWDETPLHLAVDRDIEIVKLLIDSGADVNAKDEDGSTPLHLAVDRDIEIVKLLIDSGADVGAKNKYGKTLLHYAVDMRNIELVKLLIKAGATE